MEDLGGSAPWTTGPAAAAGPDDRTHGPPGVGLTATTLRRPHRTAAPSRRTDATVLVADDHLLWLSALERDLVARLEVVDDQRRPGDRAPHLGTRPDVLVLDLNLPGMRGDEVCRAIGDLPTGCSSSRPVASSTTCWRRSRPRHRLPREVGLGEEIVAAVRATARGEAVFTPGLAGLVLGDAPADGGEARDPRHLGARPGRSPTTPRETEVLRLVATGMSYKEIAGELYVSHRPCRTTQNTSASCTCTTGWSSWLRPAHPLQDLTGPPAGLRGAPRTAVGIPTDEVGRTGRGAGIPAYGQAGLRVGPIPTLVSTTTDPDPRQRLAAGADLPAAQQPVWPTARP